MTEVFADTYFWIALLDDQDQGHPAAEAAGRLLRGVRIRVTEEVLTEVLNYFAELGRASRMAAIALIEGILNNPDVVIHPRSRQTFLDGFALYKARPDKGYSLTDCFSMTTMRQEGIAEILTHDKHFAQEGFKILL